MKKCLIILCIFLLGACSQGDGEGRTPASDGEVEAKGLDQENLQTIQHSTVYQAMQSMFVYHAEYGPADFDPRWSPIGVRYDNITRDGVLITFEPESAFLKPEHFITCLIEDEPTLVSNSYERLLREAPSADMYEVSYFLDAEDLPELARALEFEAPTEVHVLFARLENGFDDAPMYIMFYDANNDRALCAEITRRALIDRFSSPPSP